MIALQLNPPLKFVSAVTGHRLTAHVMLDYGTEWETIFLCCDETNSEPWWVGMQDLRFDSNMTFRRGAPGQNV
jgi:hypothetical protein